MYAVGRAAHHYDMPAVRAITRDAARDDYRFSSLVHGDREERAVPDAGSTEGRGSEASRTNVHHEEAPVTAHVPARRGRHAVVAACSSRWCRRSRRCGSAPRRRKHASAASTSRTGRRCTSGRRRRKGATSIHGDPEPRSRSTATSSPSSAISSHDSATGADAGAEHARSAAIYLSGGRPQKNAVRVGVTMDQIAAMQIGQDTPLPSLELGIEDVSLSCGAGYGCAYFNTISWRTPTAPLPVENSPQAVFEKLFGDGGTSEQRLGRKREDRSILDSIRQQTQSLQNGLPPRTALRVRLPRRHPGDRTAHQDGPRSRRDAGRPRRAGRHSRSLRGSRQADVRPAGARLPERDDARVDADVREGPEPGQLSRQRQPRRVPRRVAPRQRPRSHGLSSR